MFSTIFLIFEIIGTISFAVSGAALGVEKKMDILGVLTLGLTTSVGGGVIRDIILGRTPPATFENPIYAITAICTSIIVFIPFIRKLILNKMKSAYSLIMLFADSLGMGIFTVTGIKAAHALSYTNNIFLLVFVGVITGCGGGVLRDVLAGNPPYIFVKHFYATASIIGAVVCTLMWNNFGELVSMLVGTGVVLTLRLLAAYFRWNLPKA